MVECVRESQDYDGVSGRLCETNEVVDLDFGGVRPGEEVSVLEILFSVVGADNCGGGEDVEGQAGGGVGGHLKVLENNYNLERGRY